MQPMTSAASDNAMRAAFTAAGYQPPDERLREIAVRAWAKWPKADAGGARRDYVVAKLRGEMTWCLIEQWQPSALAHAVGTLLNRVRDEIEAERPERHAGRPAGGGHGRHETQSVTALATNRARPAKVERGSGEAKARANPIGQPPSAPPSHARTMAAKIAVAARLSRLDTVTIDGRPIGDCTVAEVRMWAAQRQADARAAGRDARFALSLAANLPGGAVIREYWRDADEIERIYTRAEADHAA